MPDDIELCAIQLPGREERAYEKPIDDEDILLENLTNVLMSISDKPLAFYGHCIGANLAYLLVSIERKLQPQHLFLAACLPPHLPNFSQRKIFGGFSDRKYRWEDIEDNIAFAYMREIGYTEELLQNQIAMTHLLPSIKAEFALQLNHHFSPFPPLNCPITAFGGDKDPLCTLEQLREWDRYTNDCFNIEELSGGHLFLNEDTERLLQHILFYLGVVKSQ